MGNLAARFVSICSPAPAASLSQPCPRRFWPTLGSWLLPQRCTCWARLDAGTLCRPGPDYTAACREGTHPQSKETQNKQTEGGKKHVFSPYVYKKYVWMSEKLHYVDHTANDCGLTPTAWCFRPRLSKKSSREWRSSRWLTAASITSITWNHRSMLSTDQSCDRSRGGAHLGHMFQELRAREAVLCGATVCSVVEKAEELRVQLKQSATDKNHTVPQMYTHGTCCWTATRKLNL